MTVPPHKTDVSTMQAAYHKVAKLCSLNHKGLKGKPEYALIFNPVEISL
jgi:hypothetical protein